MAQIFHPRWNTLAPASLLMGTVLVAAGGWTLHAIYWSPYATQVGLPREQPVPFSHKHHVAGLGIDCRYCHTSVEHSAFAGLPSTETCMTCHSQVWTNAPVLEAVRQSWASGRRLQWTRVNDSPDFVFFHHGIHVSRGIECSTCHGPVEEMPLTWQAQTLYMKWCLECHRNPQAYLPQPPHHPPEDTRLPELRAALTDCGICHR